MKKCKIQGQVTTLQMPSFYLKQKIYQFLKHARAPLQIKQQYLAKKKSLVGINTLNRILLYMLCSQATLKS